METLNNQRQSAVQTGTVLSSYHLSAILPVANGQEFMDAAELSRLMRDCVLKSGLHPEAEVSATFDIQGVSAVVILKESHIAVHIWPELQFATVDIHVCDFTQDNRGKADKLASLIGTRIASDASLENWSRRTLTRRSPKNATMIATSTKAPQRTEAR